MVLVSEMVRCSYLSGFSSFAMSVTQRNHCVHQSQDEETHRQRHMNVEPAVQPLMHARLNGKLPPSAANLLEVFQHVMRGNRQDCPHVQKIGLHLFRCPK